MGNRARLRALLTELKTLNFEIHFAGVNMSIEEKTATIPYIDHWVWDFYTPQQPTFWSRVFDRLQNKSICGQSMGLDHVGPDSVDRWMNFEWMDQARCLQQRGKYDVVLVEYVFHSAFLECFGLDCLKVLDTHDVFTERNKRLTAHGISEYWFSTTAEGERNGLRRADRILAIQTNDANYFNKLLGGSKSIFTVGHITSIDILPLPASPELNIGYLASDNPLNFISFNWFISDVWQPFRKEFKNVNLSVAGRICERLDITSGIQMMGEFNSVRDFYLHTHLTINPMIVGTGLKIKTIESLAYGRAVICTSVACEGLEDYVGRGIYLANSPEDFVCHIRSYLQDSSEFQRGGTEAAMALEELNEAWRIQLRLAFEI